MPPKRNFDYQKRVIFIVGLPRSGTTLLHQIISNNKNVFGAGEMVFFNEPFYESYLTLSFDVNFLLHNLQFYLKVSLDLLSSEIFY